MDRTRYSKIFVGAPGNHSFDMRFDVTTGGFVGITQMDNGDVTDRVLLTKSQFNALVDFVKQKKGGT